MLHTIGITNAVVPGLGDG